MRPTRRRPSPRARAAVALAVLPLAIASASAQTVHVTLRDSLSGAPVGAALVAAVTTDGRTLVERLSDGEGSVTLRLPGPGTVQVRVRRIGIVPTVSGAVTVASGETTRLDLRPPRTQQPLPPVVVTERCGDAARGGRAGVLWEQLVIALRSSELRRDDASGRTLLASSTRTTELDAGLGVRGTAVSRTIVGTGRPFTADDPDSLRLLGYVRREPDGMVAFYAPDDGILASDEFRAMHCFSVPKRSSDDRLAEVRFVPAPWRREIADIEGSAFVDTASGEPRRVAFRYVTPRGMTLVSAPHAGGEIEVQRLDDGTWIVSRWALRLPLAGVDPLTRRRSLFGYREFSGEATPTPPRLAGGTAAPPDAVAVAATRPTMRLLIAATDAEDGEGIAEALVEAGSDTVRTDSDGIARLALPADTVVTLRLSRASHVPLDTVVRTRSADSAVVFRLARTRPRRTR